MARFSGYLIENPNGKSHLIPIEITTEQRGLCIRVDVPKEHANFPNASDRLQQIILALEQAGIKHEVLRVSSSHNRLPDCVCISCERA